MVLAPVPLTFLTGMLIDDEWSPYSTGIDMLELGVNSTIR